MNKNREVSGKRFITLKELKEDSCQEWSDWERRMAWGYVGGRPGSGLWGCVGHNKTFRYYSKGYGVADPLTRELHNLI